MDTAKEANKVIERIRSMAYNEGMWPEDRLMGIQGILREYKQRIETEHRKKK